MCEVKTRRNRLENSRSILDEEESLGASRVACNFEQFDYQQFDEIKIENINSLGFKICSQSPGADQSSRKIIIHSIDCENFKSFFGKITLGPFGPGMSCIIGPNGSGKSNVIDSLLFVFGYRASKIRSRKLAVLIHNSSKEEHCRFASVTVNFHIFMTSKPQDLSNQQSNTECNGEYFEKLSVKRVVQQNSSSSYFINDCPSSYRQVTDVLKKYDIDLLNSRFLILQGEVEQISQMKPKRQPGDTHDGMLEYIEEIIGTNILAEPIKTYEGRLNLLKEYEGFLTNQKNNVELELGQLEGKKDEVLKFIELENQTNSLKFYKFHRQLQTQIQSLESKKIESDARKDRSKEASQLLIEINTKIKEKGKLKAQYQSKCSKIQSSLREWHKKFSNCEARDAKLQTMLRHYETEESNCSRKLEEMKKELEDNCCIDEQKINEKAEKLKHLIEMTDKSIETCRSHLDAALENFEKETRPLQRTKEEEMKKCTPLQDKSNEIKIKAAACMNELNRLQSERDSLIKDIVDCKEECTRLRTVGENINTDIKNCESELEKYENGLAKVLSDIRNLEIQINEIRNEISEKNEILAQQQSLTSGSSSSIELKKLLEFLLAQHRRGEIEGKIYGRLVFSKFESNLYKTYAHRTIQFEIYINLIHVNCCGLFETCMQFFRGDFLITEQKFNIAVSTCSSRFDNIVVDRVDTAIQCVNLMKKHSAGTASFICLDKMSQVPQINPQNQDKVDGVPIFHVVECLEKEVLPAAYFAIGNAILASDLSVAQKLAFGTSNSKIGAAGKRVITLEGQIIEPSGVMSGGDQNNDSNLTVLGGNSVMLLSNNEISAIKLSLEGLIEKLSSLQLNLRNMQKVKGECDTKIAHLSPRLQKLNKQKADPMSSKSLEIVESKLKALELQFEEFKRDKFSLIEETEARHKKLSVSLQRALDKLSEQKQEHDRIAAELQAMQSKLIDPLRVDLEKKEKLQIEQKVDLNKCNIKEARLEFDSLSKKIEEAGKKHQEVLSKYESTGAEIKENEEKALEASQAIQTLDSELKELEDNFSNSKKSDDDFDNEENLDKIALNLRTEMKKLNEEMSMCNNEMIKLKCNIEK
ncbi:MAG: Structural maintenance of chromosomes protein 4, partial [Marteilia pararefringens]